LGKKFMTMGELSEDLKYLFGTPKTKEQQQRARRE
jgi:hypothetical protein